MYVYNSCIQNRLREQSARDVTSTSKCAAVRCCFQLYAHSGFGSVYGNTVDAGGVTATDEETVDAVSVRVPLPQVQRFVVRAAEKRLHRLAVVCSRRASV